MVKKTVTKQRLEKYFDITSRALAKVKFTNKDKKAAEEFFDMASRYFKDAKHFKEKGDWVTAFAALNYAHGWLDAGARYGLFDVGGDSELFTVD